MTRTFGTFEPAHPKLANLARRISAPIYRSLSARNQMYSPDSRYAQERGSLLHQKLQNGETAYLLGIGPGSHNAGMALVETSLSGGTRILFNNEEERYTGIKHCAQYPRLSVEAVRHQMAILGIKPKDLVGCFASFDFSLIPATGLATLIEEAPKSLSLLKASTGVETDLFEILTRVPRFLGEQLGLKAPFPVIGMRHHNNHAYFSYAVSPFAHTGEPVMIATIDGTGEDGATSLYVAQQENVKLVFANTSIYDSLGMLYGILSSTQGGWTILSSEGRYMGAAAWGNNDRLTNPYYQQLRQLIYFRNNGEFYINRSMANWQRQLFTKPYTPALEEILGPPIALKDMWNPDAILSVEDIEHSEVTQERLDKAAATQLLFEDVLFHIIGHLIRVTKSNKLVLTGGCALNCIANMRLLERFNEDYYERYVGKKQTQLHLWVPPIPGDAGTPVGAAFQFALKNGGQLGEPLQHAFYCGLAPETKEIVQALEADGEIAYIPLGNALEESQRVSIADLAAYIVAHDGVLGIFQGQAETGPRALGHRSIIANPCNPQTRYILNDLVKHRERIRPLAPMVTLEAAHKWFILLPGASDDNYNAYNYMIMTAQARPESYAKIPAVIHKDGTGRVQIVREEVDPFIYAYLKAMGRRVGAEVSVNTSLNVGSPIVQTPAQALQCLKRARGMHGLLMIGHDGTAFLAWHNVIDSLKDAGVKLREWVRVWQEELSITLV